MVVIRDQSSPKSLAQSTRAKYSIASQVYHSSTEQPFNQQPRSWMLIFNKLAQCLETSIKRTLGKVPKV